MIAAASSEGPGCAERALKTVEINYPQQQTSPEPDATQIFTYEEAETARRRSHARYPFCRQLSYSDCLNSVFILFAAAGVVGMIVCLVRLRTTD